MAEGFRPKRDASAPMVRVSLIMGLDFNSGSRWTVTRSPIPDGGADALRTADCVLVEHGRAPFTPGADGRARPRGADARERGRGRDARRVAFRCRGRRPCPRRE